MTEEDLYDPETKQLVMSCCCGGRFCTGQFYALEDQDNVGKSVVQLAIDENGDGGSIWITLEQTKNLIKFLEQLVKDIENG